MGKFLRSLPRAALVFVKNPINTVFALAVFYFAAKVYIFGGGFTDKLFMTGAILLWALWFMAKHMLLLLLVVLLIAGGGYAYYAYNQKLKAECEQSGGSWNSNTKVCEEKVSFQDKVRRLWKGFTGSSDKK